MDEKPKMKKIVSGTATKKRPSLKEKFVGVFFQESVDDLKKYIWSDIVIPAIRDLISDTVNRGSDFLLYGQSRRPSPKGRTFNTTSGYVPYNAVSTPTRAAQQAQPSTQRNSIAPTDVVLSDKGEAEAVLDALIETVDYYGQASRGDLLDSCGMRTEHTDYKWGWKDLSTAAVVRIRDGYLIKMPREIPLD